MKTITLLFTIFLFNISIAQERNQYVKWGSAVYYTKSVDSRLEDSINPGIFCDVAIGHNDIFDSSPLYLGLSMDYAIRNSVNALSGGVNIKKFIDPGNNKTNFYLVAGGKLTLFKNYSRYISDYNLNIGVGIALNSFTEINTIYNYGISDLEYYKAHSLSLGIKMFFQKNWWY